MHRGQEVIVLKNGVRINQESMSLIGIIDGSSCWGHWVPDRNQWPPNNQNSNYEHLLVSPFFPASWPVLLRIELYLKNDMPGTIAAALGPIVQEQISILSIEATPAGHRHAIVTIIGEAVKLKGHDGPFGELMDIQDKKRTFSDDNLWQKVHDEFANVMLRKSQQVEQAIEMADEQEMFLREIFLHPDHKRWERGVLFSPKSLSRDVKNIGEKQRTKAVKCTWLQNLAFFWIYGRNTRDAAIDFCYEAKFDTLRVIKQDAYARGLKGKSIPFGTVASFDLNERYMRLVISKEDKPGRTVRVTIPYESKYKPYVGSRGFQHQLYSGLAAKDISLRHVSMSMQRQSWEDECGTLSILASLSSNDQIKDLDNISNDIKESAKTAAEMLRSQSCRMVCENIKVMRFSARKLFFSTKLDWIRSDQPNIIKKVQALASIYGFNLLMAIDEMRHEVENLVPEIRHEQSITKLTTLLIQNADVFLQIIPRTVLQSEQQIQGHMNWLEYEFGAAQALNLPCEVLVDCNSEIGIDQWKQFLRVGSDFHMIRFNSGSNDEQLLEKVEKALTNFII